MPEKSDNYYTEQATKAIDVAVKESEGKTLDEIRFAIRRAYPFGPLRKGRPYKIWRKLMLEKEAALGLEPKKHANARVAELADQQPAQTKQPYKPSCWKQQRS